ncbi:MAG: carbon-nitrogen hydrolase family protein [Bacteroidales bacterium]
MSKIKIASVAMVSVPDKAVNLAKMLCFIDEAAQKGVDLIAFPEFCLPGIPTTFTMMSTNIDATSYWVNAAEYVPEGDSVQALIAKAKERNIYISWTMSEQDKEYCDRFYNCGVLVGPEGFIGKYRKIQQPGTERLFFHPGNEIPVFDTKIGRIGMMICFDRWWPEIARCLKIGGAEIILAMSAWPGTDKSTGEDDFTLNLWTSTGYCRTLENAVVLVDSCGASPENITRMEEGLEAGHARMYSPEGYVIVTTGWEEDMAIAEIDPKAAIANCFATFGLGNMDSIRDLRTDIYIPYFEKHRR